ncbi:Neuronal acetylcholine receptor subunit alpha-9 [Mizuhopecten yessoensis]|uniref:Neuronal acetylcholine receptor subunit alpha-9 n=1 Tax=Mizuhopecten yessoensis TaxID=6573 RepID=A0A210R393_MIZYE|nr:Neuronal acetylcholine receptor subunit alpha-9 [Mizuhopecten yessoensis]
MCIGIEPNGTKNSNMELTLLCIVIMFIMLNVNVVTAETMADVSSLYTHLLTGYDARVRPTADDQHQAINMTLTFSLNFIKTVDVTTGEFTVMGSVTTQWNDPRMAWTPSMRGGAYSITLPRHTVWTPEFTVIKSFDTSDSLGHPKYNVQFVYDGTAVWTFDDKLRAVCNYDVSDYPFDVQTCAVALSPVGMTSSQLRLIIATSTADVTDLVESDAWEYVSSSVTVVDIEVQLPPNTYPIPKVSICITVVLLVSSVICILTILNRRFNTRCQREHGPKHPKHTWTYEVTDEEKHTNVTVLPSKEATEGSKCEANCDL